MDDLWTSARAIAGVFLLLFLLACLSRQAAAQEAGGVRGTVVDADFRSPVPGAQLSVVESGLSAATNDSGRFTIEGLPAGKYTLAVSREGYVRKQLYDIVVTARQYKELEVELALNVVELEDVVVSADDLVSSGSTASLIDIRASLTNFVDSVGAEFIKLTGASDAGAALKRVVGTSVVDKKYVVVRGLADRYNTVTLNGLKIPSSDPDKRAVNVDLFPGGLIGAINNTKTFSAELPSESTGGNVDIVLKARVDKPFVNASIKLGYNSNATHNAAFVTYRGPHTGTFGTRDQRQLPGFLRGSTSNTFGINPPAGNLPAATTLRLRAARTLDPTTGVSTAAPPEDISINLEAGTRLEFFGRPLAVLAGFTYAKEYRFDPRTIVGKVNQRDDSESQLYDTQTGTESLLSAAFLNLGYEFDPDHRIRVTAFTNIAAEDLASFGLRHRIETPDRVFIPYKYRGGPDEGTNILTIRESLQYTERRLRTLQISGEHGFGGRGSLQWGAAYSMSSQDQPDSRAFGSAEGALGGLERVWNSLADDNYNVRLEYKVPLFGLESPSPGVGFKTDQKRVELRVGLNLDHSVRSYRSDLFVINSGNVSNSGQLSPDDRLGLTQADVTGRAALNDPSNTFLYRKGPPGSYSARQNVFAGYGSLSIDLAESLKATVGARVEVFDLDVNPTVSKADVLSTGDAFSDVFFNNDLLHPAINFSEPKGAKIATTDVLPSLSATWDFAKNMKLRLGVSRTVARPSFKELAPVYTRIPVSLSRFVGNFQLVPSSITNYDLRWEWYPHPGDIVAVSAFSKAIENPIEFVDAGQISYYFNEKSAYVYGLEFETSKNLGSLSEALRPFTLTGNFAWMFSKVTLTDNHRDERAGSHNPLFPATRRLQGQPDYILNVGAIYDNKDLGLNCGLFLNVVGTTLWAAGSNVSGLFLDAYQQPLTSMDAVISKKLTKNLKLTLRATNLTDPTVLRTYPDGRLYSQRRDGRNLSLSIGGEW